MAVDTSVPQAMTSAMTLRQRKVAPSQFVAVAVCCGKSSSSMYEHLGRQYSICSARGNSNLLLMMKNCRNNQESHRG